MRLPFFDSEQGLILFSNLQTFNNGIQQYFINAGKPELKDLYTYPEIYSRTKAEAKSATNYDKFLIKFVYKE